MEAFPSSLIQNEYLNKNEFREKKCTLVLLLIERSADKGSDLRDAGPV
jgi:hypothetical protein